MAACPTEAATGLLLHICACVVHDAPGSPAARKPPARPNASVLHLRPPTRSHPPNASHQGTTRSDNQPVKVRRFRQRASKRKPPKLGGQRLASNASASRLRSSSTTYKATPSGHSLAPDSARVSSC